jgi:hypothetical protein
VRNRNAKEAVYCWFTHEMSRGLSIQTLRTLQPASDTDNHLSGEGNLMDRCSTVCSNPVCIMWVPGLKLIAQSE